MFVKEPENRIDIYSVNSFLEHYKIKYGNIFYFYKETCFNLSLVIYNFQI